MGGHVGLELTSGWNLVYTVGYDDLTMRNSRMTGLLYSGWYSDASICARRKQTPRVGSAHPRVAASYTCPRLANIAARTGVAVRP